jgi:HD-like signal output (HDOD) protein
MESQEILQTEGALPTLLALMEKDAGFAGAAASGPVVSGMVDDDSGDSRRLIAAVTRDIGLTAKLLRLANSSARSARSVTTVEQAISVLGLGTVGRTASELPCMDAISNKAQLRRLRAEFIAAIFCGELATLITRHNGQRFKPQESQVCGLLQNLGRLMSTYYLYERIEAARHRQAEKNLSEAEAISQVLGRSFEEIGGAIAQAWQFPDTVQHSLEAGKGKVQPKASANPADWLQTCPLFTRHVANILFRMPDEREKIEIGNEANFFKQSLILKNDELAEWIESALANTSGVLAELEFPLTLAQARTELRKASEHTHDVISPQDSLAKSVGGMKSPIDRINLALRMLHTEFEFDLTMLVLPEGGAAALAVTGIGRHANHVVPKFHCQGEKQDLVRLMMAKGSDIYVPDTTSAAFVKLLPPWYQGVVGAKSMQLTALSHEGKLRGMLYGDYTEGRPAVDHGKPSEAVQKWLDMIIDALDPHHA